MGGGATANGLGNCLEGRHRANTRAVVQGQDLEWHVRRAKCDQTSFVSINVSGIPIVPGSHVPLSGLLVVSLQLNEVAVYAIVASSSVRLGLCTPTSNANV